MVHNITKYPDGATGDDLIVGVVRDGTSQIFKYDPFVSYLSISVDAGMEGLPRARTD